MNDNLQTGNAPEAGKPWEFNEDVANVFGDMLSRSIPGYNDMRDITFRIGMPAPGKRHELIIDLGASTGESIFPFISAGASKRYMLTDVSEPMLEKLRERYTENLGVYIDKLDLRQRHDALSQALTVKNYSGTLIKPNLVLSILTILFVPINFRPNIVRGVYEALESGGKFIMTEKLQGSDYLIDNMLVDAYHKYKHDNGYSWEAIERKRMALENVQVPMTEAFNMNMLRSAGFKHVEVVHRHLNFATFVAVKE